MMSTRRAIIAQQNFVTLTYWYCHTLSKRPCERAAQAAPAGVGGA